MGTAEPGLWGLVDHGGVGVLWQGGAGKEAEKVKGLELDARESQRQREQEGGREGVWRPGTSAARHAGRERERERKRVRASECGSAHPAESIQLVRQGSFKDHSAGRKRRAARIFAKIVRSARTTS